MILACRHKVNINSTFGQNKTLYHVFSIVTVHELVAMWTYMITVVYLICLVFFIGYVYDDAFGDWVVCDGNVACRRLFLSIFLVLSNFWNVSFQQCTSVYIIGQVFYSKIISCLKLLFYRISSEKYISIFKSCFLCYRFYAIVCPLSSGKAVRNIKTLLASAWIISILCASPQVSL